MADANGGPAEPLQKADVGILVCGDLKREFPKAKDYWIIDGAIAAENKRIRVLCPGFTDCHDIFYKVLPVRINGYYTVIGKPRILYVFKRSLHCAAFAAVDFMVQQSNSGIRFKL